ncbi:MAG: glycosyltransferase family 39 protein [Anaerolineaceae bacterium]|nr:glycosyltransferase family 39 protein [Anaerolineaceae bacterium]
MKQKTISPHILIVLFLVGFSFFMSALVSQTVFERLPHLEDEVAYLFQAKLLAGGHSVIPSPEPRRAYWQPFIIDRDGQRFGKYSLGWPGTLAGGVLLGQPWVINAFLAALTVALVYRLGSDVFNQDTGVIAAALTAFSPMALLLNATLMGHTAALFWVTLFMWAYWQLEHRRRPLRWGIVAGVALGMTLINRPLSAVGIAAPFVVWSAIRVVWWGFPILFMRDVGESLKSFLARNTEKWQIGALFALAIVTLLIGAVIPLYNQAATGNAGQNLYTLVWPYDKVGFGEDFGRRGHTLEKGLRQTGWDLSLTAADLFGWQPGTITPELQEHLRTNSDYWPVIGRSWVLLPFGLLIGWKRRWLWLLVGVMICLIGVHTAYWIGSQRYSTRYYYEALTAAALVSALPLAWAARHWKRWPVYLGLTVALLYSLYAYSTPRITALYRFNEISPELIQAVEARRTDDRPILALVTGDSVRWRAYGALMSVTSPYLDSDIVAALDNTQPGVRDAILARFPDRQVIELLAEDNYAWFPDQPRPAELSGE